MTWAWALAWAAAPVAFLAEAAAARRAVAGREPLAEAWLAAGARPREVLARLRRGIPPAPVVAAALLAIVLVAGPAAAPAHVWAALAATAAAGFAASGIVTLRTFVDSRLVDRSPPEAESPFRVGPAPVPATLEIHESRPPEPPPIEPPGDGDEPV